MREILQAPAPSSQFLTDVVSPGFPTQLKVFDPSEPVSNIYTAVRTPQVSSFKLIGSNKNITLGDDDVLLALETSRTSGWFALGRSPNGDMIDSDVVVAQYQGSTVKSISPFHLTAEAVTGVNPYPQLEIANAQVLNLKNPSRRLLIYTRKAQQGNQPIMFGQKQFYIHSFAPFDQLSQGQHDYASGNSITIAQPNSQSTVSQESQDSSQSQSSSESEGQAMVTRSKRFRVHGILNFIAFIALIPMGAIISRNKAFETGPESNQQPKRLPIWFILHVLIQCSAAGLAISAVIIAVIKNSDFGTENKGVEGAHKVIGILLFSLIWFQLAISIVRPKRVGKDGKPGLLRKIWQLTHFMVGRLIIVFGIINVPIGITLLSKDINIKKWRFMGAYVALVIFWGLLAIILEPIRLLVPRKHKKQSKEGNGQINSGDTSA